MNKEMLKDAMRAHGDTCGRLAAAIGMSPTNFSTIWNGRAEFSLKYIRAISSRYQFSPDQVYQIFIFPE